uniref:Secreted protein n=1 Tax=Heterorhabditis bacteriophora TaxID=37862 RepID=A0A1I7X6J0_HETBA
MQLTSACVLQLLFWIFKSGFRDLRQNRAAKILGISRILGFYTIPNSNPNMHLCNLKPSSDRKHSGKAEQNMSARKQPNAEFRIQRHCLVTNIRYTFQVYLIFKKSNEEELDVTLKSCVTSAFHL